MDINWTNVLITPWAIPVIFGCIVGAVAIVANVCSECIQHMGQMNLKRAMVERGYSVADIERVLRASAGDDLPHGKPVPPLKA